MNNFIISSCSDDELPLEYRIFFKNNYFETIIVEIDTLKIPRLLPNQMSKPIFLQNGIYEIHCTTKSNLLIESKLNLKGYAKHINIILNKKGKIIFDE